MKTKTLVYLALSCALVCLISPISFPLGTISVTLAIFIITIIGILFKPLYALIIILMYICIGLIGLPVYSNFTGGISVLLGITGGYIIGYIPFILVISFFNTKEKPMWKMFLSCLFALAICYLFGTLWFMMETRSTILETLLLTVLPFVAFDIIKIFMAILISTKLKTRLSNI